MEIKKDGTTSRRAGMDDQRSKVKDKNEAREDKGSFTDTVMENQALGHEVVRV